MTHDKLTELLDRYAKAVADLGPYSRYDADFDRRGCDLLNAQVAHAGWMLGQMSMHCPLPGEDEPDPGVWSEDKMQRWLGFVQGVLWMAGVYTIEELRKHTREEAGPA